MDTAAKPTLDRDHPWPGLDSFDELDSGFFHGRKAEAAELLRLIERGPLTVLFGRSGLGKTSLLKAGVFPLLRAEDLLPVYLRLDHLPGAPALREQLLHELRRACDAAGVQGPELAPGEGPWSLFHRRDAEFWNARHRLVTPVIVFDQFEEIFTFGQRDDAARARAAEFIVELAALVENRPDAAVRQRLEEEPEAASRWDFRRANVKLVLSFREDFLAEFEGLKALMPSLMYNRLRLLPMDGEQAYAVVTEGGGELVDDEVARRILRLAWRNEAGAPVEREAFARIEIDPALLSVVCSELNLKRLQATPPLRQITPALLGGADREILNGFYERSVAGLDPRARAFVEDELITDRGFRDSHDWDDALAKPGVTREALEAMVARRLLRVDERQGQRRLELTHDVLTRVVRDSRDQRRAREAEAAAQQREEAARVQQRKNARNAIGVLTGVMLMLVLGAVTLWQGRAVHEARRLADLKTGEAEALLAQARSTRLMATADGLQARQLDASLLVNLEALRESPTLDAQAGLLRRFDSRRHLASFLGAHAREVTAVGFGADARRLVSADEDGTLVVWDLATRQPLFSLAGRKSAVTSVAFSADGHWLAAAGRDNVVTLWNLQTRKAEATFEGHRAAVWSLAFAPDGSVLASAGADQTVILWDLAGRQRRAILGGHERAILALAFSPDGQRLASAGSDAAVSLWTVASARPAGRLEGHDGEIAGLAFSADGRRLAAATSEQTVAVWDLAGGRAPLALKGHKGAVARVAFAEGGERLVSVGFDQTVVEWDLASGKALRTLEGVRDQVARVALSADGRWLASTGTEPGVMLSDLQQRQGRHPLGGHRREVYSAAFSADGKRAATAGADRLVMLWDPATGQSLATLSGHNGEVWGLAFSRDGRVLASASSDASVGLWDPASGQALATLTGHKSRVLGVAISADGQRLASASEDHNVILWDLPARKALATLQGHRAEVASVAFSPDGARLASAGSDGTVILWDLAAAKPQTRLDARMGMILGIAFSPDGQALAAATEEGTVVLWSLAGGVQLAALQGHSERVTSVAFSPDGRWLASTSADKSVVLWDLQRRLLLATLRGFDGEVNGAVFSPDGKRLLVVSDRDPAAQLWDLDRELLAGNACRAANRNLGCQEWRQLVGPDLAYRKTCAALPGPAQVCE